VARPLVQRKVFKSFSPTEGRHKSKANFLHFAQHEEYQKTLFYRSAALADSRLLPMTTGNFKK
jgi:hypothetical protein